MSLLFLIVVSSAKKLETGIKSPLYKVAVVMNGGGTDGLGGPDDNRDSE